MLTASEARTTSSRRSRPGARATCSRTSRAGSCTHARGGRARRGRHHAGHGRPHPGRVRAPRATGGRPRRPERLTERELEVLRLVTAGPAQQGDRGELGITENTVKFHLRNILDKLHAPEPRRGGRARRREGLVELAELTAAHGPFGTDGPTRSARAPTHPDRVARHCRLPARCSSVVSAAEAAAWATASTIDRGDCINCGMCMDVCPVQAST